MIQKNFTNEFSFRTSRSSGAGGQHVNKVSSKVELLFHVDASKLLTVQEKATIKKKLNNRISVDGYLNLTSQDTRSQHRNKQIAIDRFHELVAKVLKKVKKRIPVGVPAGVKERRLQNKRFTSEKKQLRGKVALPC